MFWPYNTTLLLDLLGGLYNAFIPDNERGVVRSDICCYNLCYCCHNMLLFGTVSFHHADLVKEWFTPCEHISVEFFTTLFTLPQLNRGILLVWSKHAYDHRLHNQLSLRGHCMLLVKTCQGWMQHSRKFFPLCLGRQVLKCCGQKENIV